MSPITTSALDKHFSNTKLSTLRLDPHPRLVKSCLTALSTHPGYSQLITHLWYCPLHLKKSGSALLPSQSSSSLTSTPLTYNRQFYCIPRLHGEVLKQSALKLASVKCEVAVSTLRTEARALASSAAADCALSGPGHPIHTWWTPSLMQPWGHKLGLSAQHCFPSSLSCQPPNPQEVMTHKMPRKVIDSSYWPINADIYNAPTAQLPSRRSVWKNIPTPDFTIQMAWELEWESTESPKQTSGARH